MARTSYSQIDPGLQPLFSESLNSNDRFVFSRFTRKDTLLSRRRKAGVSARSLLPQIAALWAAFSEGERTAWSDAAAENGMKGWNLFVQDQSIRIKNDLVGVAAPSLLHQSWVGNIKISSPASSIKLVQFHPRFYWVSRPVPKHKAMRQPVQVTEDFSLPLTISLNYSADLTSVGGGSFAKFYAKIWSSYQGVNRYTLLEIPLTFSTGWVHAEATVSEVLGYLVNYELYIEIYNATGDLFFDNISAFHSEQNWVRDPFCKAIATTFTRAFYQIPMNWAVVSLPEGAEYDTIYQDF